MARIEYVRVRDNEIGHEMSIPVARFNEAVFTKVDKPATNSVGDPLPVKHRALRAAPEEGYDSLKVDELNEEIDRRNEDRGEADLIKPDSGKKADLVAALEADDNTTTGDTGGKSGQTAATSKEKH
jgi:hypothetical protein